MSRYGRLGLAVSGIFLAFSGLWILFFSQGPARWLSLSLVCFGLYNLSVSLKEGVRLSRVNVLALSGHICALFAFYLFSTRFLTVVYATDSMVGTYMGIIKTLHGQNPYLFSIKPFLDQFGFPPSYYTPRVDGSFEFHLNYPALNFLSLLPSYLVGLHDLRDGVLFFHVLSILVVFHLAPSRLKPLSIVPFALGFPLAIVYSWTDSVWAFFLILSALYWNRDRRVSLVTFGLAAATKQIAFAAMPFLLVGLWIESEGSRLRGLLRGVGLILAGYLVPNLPFILTSPSAWWSGTVAPYLPWSTPMVAGGIGLSEILADLGLVLSSSFYTVLAGIAGVATILLFFFRFQRVKHLMWAMPGVVLFFYPRSFPNYLVYWLFPLIVERLVNGPFNLGVNLFPKLAITALRTPGRLSPGAFKRRTWASLLIFLSLTMVFAGVSGAYVSRVSASRVEVQVENIADPDNLGAATVLNGTLTNYRVDTIWPKFFVKWYFLPFFWNTRSNSSLPANSKAPYVIAATDALAAIPRGSQFKVLVFDSKTGDFVGQSKLFTSNLVRPPIANPHFQWWALDAATGKQVPYGWKLTLVNTEEPFDGINALNQTLSSGVQMRLNYTSTRTSPTQVAVTQKLLFNETNLKFVAFQTFTTNSPGKVVLGARLTDGTHLLFFILSSTASQESVSTYSENTTVTIPVNPFTWSSVVLDTPTVWRAQGWAEPTNVDFSLYIEASFHGYYFANVKEIAEATSQTT